MKGQEQSDQKKSCGWKFANFMGIQERKVRGLSCIRMFTDGIFYLLKNLVLKIVKVF